MAQVTGEVKRFAPDPHIRADTQGSFGFAHATKERKQRDAGEKAQCAGSAQVLAHVRSQFPSGTKM
jgi:hypothetical protein